MDLTRTGPLVLVGGYQTPAALRAISATDLATDFHSVIAAPPSGSVG